jgi:S-DNA-T family DNA segregation ATPase FtsK/SpoIIIE
MAKKVNKENSDKKGIELNETKKVDAMKPQNFVQDGRLSKIIGLLFLLLGFGSLIAYSSYMFTWKIDQDKVFKFSWHILFQGDQVEVTNKLGRLGAFVAHQSFFNGIGICAFIISLLFLLVGSNLLFQRRIFPLIKVFKTSILFIVWLTATLSFCFSKYSFPLGGAMGNSIVYWLNGFAGQFGTVIILLISLLSFLVVLYNIAFKLPALPSIFIKKLQTIQGESNSNMTNPLVDNALSDEAAAILNDFEKPITATLPKPQVNNDPPLHINVFDEDNPDDGVEFELKRYEAQLPKPSYVELEADEIAEELNDAGASTGDIELELNTNNNVISETKQLEESSSVNAVTLYDPTLDLSHYKFPPLDFLNDYGPDTSSVTKEELEQNKNQIVTTLRNYNIEIERIKATIGPTVTLYEIVPAPGVRISKIKNLEDDIALSLSALGIRIIAPIPGKGTIGIEVPNIKKEMVSMRSLIASDKFQNTSMDLPIAIGKNIANENIIVDLAKMPHLLMAGATGQGKSVGLNAILVSLLYKKHPSQIKFVMVDPKKVELSIYKIIEKHFLAKLPAEEDPIITDTKKVVHTLNSLCIEMDRRYDLLKEATCRNLKEYNQKFIERKLNPQKGHEYLPYIVVVIDEFADLIMTAGKEVETPIARIAQLARAVGIHLIIATQRPSVNIITGVIKANFPARIAFKVSSKIDSRTILDSGGADQLIGKGDLLLSLGGELIRVQCAFVDTPEIEKITEHISKQQGYPSAHILPEYEDPNDPNKGDLDLGNERDEFFEEAAKIVVQHQQGSTSLIQRRLKLGYNRAGRIMDQLETIGIVGPNAGSKARDVKYKTEAELMEYLSRILK